MQIHTSETTVAGTIVVSLEGPVDLSTIAMAREAVLATVRRHHGEHIAVDLDAVTVLDDTGLGILLGAAATARESGGDLTVVCSDPSRRARLARTRLDQAITVRDSIG